MLAKVKSVFEQAVHNGKLESIKLEQQLRRQQRKDAGQPNDYYR